MNGLLAALTGPWSDPGPLELPVSLLEVPSRFEAFLSFPLVKLLFPIPILMAIAPAIWWFFKSTWRELDAEATRYRVELAGRKRDRLSAVRVPRHHGRVLTMQEYYGGRRFFDELIRPELQAYYAAGHEWLKLPKYDELYGYAWWSFARVFGLRLDPAAAVEAALPPRQLAGHGSQDARLLRAHLDLRRVPGDRPAGHADRSPQPDFGSYYPFYKNSSRSWVDFMMWEGMYWAQFFGLELFFRGWMVGALRRPLGAAAIFAMAVPYCMIHYGKPYFEAHGAIVAGVVLGSLSMKTRSIYAGFLVHITVAVSMDLLSLYKRAALPVHFWAPG